MKKRSRPLTALTAYFYRQPKKNFKYDSSEEEEAESNKVLESSEKTNVPVLNEKNPSKVQIQPIQNLSAKPKPKLDTTIGCESGSSEPKRSIRKTLNL